MFFMPEASVAVPGVCCDTSTYQLPVQPTATIAPRPFDASRFMNGNPVWSDERPPSGVI